MPVNDVIVQVKPYTQLVQFQFVDVMQRRLKNLLLDDLVVDQIEIEAVC